MLKPKQIFVVPIMSSKTLKGLEKRIWLIPITTQKEFILRRLYRI